MSIKSFRLVKWSSWSLINESHLNTLAVCSLLPSAELCHPGQPLWNAPCSAGSSAWHHGPLRWGRDFHHHGWFMATVQKTELTWDIPATAAASQELHDPSLALPCPGPKCRGAFWESIIWGRIPSVLVPLRIVTHWPSPS